MESTRVLRILRYGRKHFRKYALAALGVAVVALHVSPHYHQQKRNSDDRKGLKAPDFNGSNFRGGRWRSVFYAITSSTLRNMVIVAFVVTVLARRFLGLHSKFSFPAFFSVAWAFIYRFRVVEAPKVFFRESFWNRTIVEKSKISQNEFWPVFWLFNRHSQTVTGFAISSLETLWARTIVYDRETIPCHDEPNVQYLDWAYHRSPVRSSLPGHQRDESDDESSDCDSFSSSPAGNQTESVDDTPILICIHGLGDSRDAPYVERFTRLAIRNSWRVVVWSWWKFDLSDSRDLKIAIDHIHARYNRAPLIGVAWSAGVYGLVQYLQKAGSDTPLVAAVCQSGCLDIRQAASDVVENENTAYPLFLLGKTHVCVRRHVANDQRIKDKSKFSSLLLEGLEPLQLFNKFFSMLPDPLPDNSDGYAGDGSVNKDEDLSMDERMKDAPHYAHKVIDNMDKIKVTTLLIHSEDDPIVASEHVNWRKCVKNRHVIAVHTHRGGHCGWYEGLMPWGEGWGDRTCCKFISAVLETQATFNFTLELVRTAMVTPEFNELNDDYVRPALAPSFDVARSHGNLTPKSIARICSSSDLATFVKKECSMRGLPKYSSKR